MNREALHRVTVAGPLDRVLRGLYPDRSWNAIRSAVRTGKVSVNGMLVCDPRTLVAIDSEIGIVPNAPRPRARPTIHILHLDRDVVVVDKPAGISTVPHEGETTSLMDAVRGLVAKREGRGAALGVVQRLDKETSGVLVFARTVAAKRALQQQFRKRSIERRYLAIASGHLTARTFRSRLVADRGDGRAGSTRHPRLGREAVTHVEVLEKLRGATLVACRLETGRRHQIRIHLAEAGHPLLGERVYAERNARAPRLMLHATSLGFAHPRTGRRSFFELPMPDDMRALVEALRA